MKVIALFGDDNVTCLKQAAGLHIIPDLSTSLFFLASSTPSADVDTDV